VRFEVLMATNMKMAVFWYDAPYSLVDITDVSEELTASIITTLLDQQRLEERHHKMKDLKPGTTVLCVKCWKCHSGTECSFYNLQHASFSVSFRYVD
jgi:hypothetical protein